MVFPADYTEPIVPAYIPGAGSDWKAAGGFRRAGRVRAGDVLCFRAQGFGKRGGGSLGLCRGRGRAHDLARKSVDVGVVRCWPVRETGYGDSGEYRIVPEMIEPPVGRACRVEAGQVKQWWLTVHVPADTPAGRYRMSLTVRPENAPPTVVEWRLLILPFQLKRPADKHWGALSGEFPAGRIVCAGRSGAGGTRRPKWIGWRADDLWTTATTDSIWRWWAVTLQQKKTLMGALPTISPSWHGSWSTGRRWAPTHLRWSASSTPAGTWNTRLPNRERSTFRAPSAPRHTRRSWDW